MPYCDGKPRKTLDTCNFLTASRDKTFVSRDESFVPRFREMVVTYFSDLHSTRGRSGCRRLQLQRKQMLKRLSTVRMNWLKRKAVTGTLKVAVVNLKMVKNIKLCMRSCSRRTCSTLQHPTPRRQHQKPAVCKFHKQFKHETCSVNAPYLNMNKSLNYKVFLSLSHL